MGSSRYTRLATLDPGLRSGTAEWTLLPGGGHTFVARIMDPADTGDWIEGWTGKNAGRNDTLFVAEAFRINADTGKKSQDGMNWPWELTGIARHFARIHGISFTQQTPAEALTFGTDEKLKRYGFWTPGKEDHARDASRHLTLMLSKLGLL